ncbi:hypothetical protein [Paenibacillus macerans]|uniref:hypothetical protein n=1 Tax=Paenibacillus macerans TaxID=44252 RepID=UPI003D31F8E9
MTNLNLDMKTVYVLLVLGHLFAVMLFSAYRNKSTKDPAINMFYASKWLQIAFRLYFGVNTI